MFNFILPGSQSKIADRKNEVELVVEDGLHELVNGRFEGDVVAASKKIQIGNSVGGPNFSDGPCISLFLIGALLNLVGRFFPRSMSTGSVFYPKRSPLKKAADTG